MLSPATVGVTVYLLLTERDRLIPRLFIYLFTVAGFYFLVGRAYAEFGCRSAIRKRHFQNRTVSWIMTIVGGVLFVISFFIPTKNI